jgi:hypothetical protein
MGLFENWLGRPFQPFSNRVDSKGYRILILHDDGAEAMTPHSSGGSLEGYVDAVPCPRCGASLFPVFKLDLSDERLSCLDLLDVSILQVLLCPSCTLYLEPYWTYFGKASVEVLGGDRNAARVLKEVRLPYPSRAIHLFELTEEDYPYTEGRIGEFINRRRPPRVYHQIGGLPFLGKYRNLDCIRCKHEMRFAGVVDNDDSNVYLHEADGKEVTLVIGDSDRLYFYVCKECTGVGIRWVH